MIWELLPAVTLPSGLKAGLSLASVSTVVSGRMPSSAVTSSSDSVTLAGLLVLVLGGDRDDLPLEAALGGGPGRVLLAPGAEGVEVLAGQVPVVGDHLGRDALGHQSADRLVAQPDQSGRREARRRWPMLAPIGTRLMTSTPAAITTSYCPAMTPWAAKCSACWDDPHWRSMVVAGTDSGKPAASTALRPDVDAPGRRPA